MPLLRAARHEAGECLSATSSRACPRRQPAVLPLTSGSVADCPQLSERVASTTSEERLRSDGLVPLKPGMLVSASIMLCCSSQNKTSLPKADDSLELAHFISTRRRHHPSGHVLLMLIPDGSTHWSRLPSHAVSLRSHKKAPTDCAPSRWIETFRNARASVKSAAPRQACRSVPVRRTSSKPNCRPAEIAHDTAQQKGLKAGSAAASGNDVLTSTLISALTALTLLQAEGHTMHAPAPCKLGRHLLRTVAYPCKST